MSSSWNRKRRNPSPLAHTPAKIQKQHNSTADDDNGTQAIVDEDHMELELPSQQAAAPFNNAFENSKVYLALRKVWEDLVGHTDNEDGTVQSKTCSIRSEELFHYVWLFIWNLRSLCGLYDYSPLIIVMNFRHTSNILQLSDIISDFGKRELENITENEVEEFCGQEYSREILKDLRERVEAHPLTLVMIQQFDSCDHQGMIF